MLLEDDPLGVVKSADAPDILFDGPHVAPAPRPEAPAPLGQSPAPTPAHPAPAAPGEIDPPAEPVGHSFIDPAATRRAIYDRTLERVSALPPLANQKYSLSLRDVAYHDPEEYSLKDQKRAILEGSTLSRRLRGTWVLSDLATGDEIAKKTSTIAHVPYYTNKGTFILGGSQYSLASQLRLRPGVYTRRKENGELDSHVNVIPGQGVSHHVRLDPESGVFKLEVSQASYPLYTVMKLLGAKDRDLRDAWGELYAANAAKDDPGAINKLHAKLVRGPNKAADGEGRKEQVAEALRKMPLDPEVTAQTLGAPHASVSPEVYLAATKKLVALSRGEIDPDDRDHLAFMTVHGPEDLISERVVKDKSGLWRALWKATMKGDLSALPAGVFTKAMQAAVTGSGLGQPLEQINPSMVIEQMGRISRMGVGGIPCYSADTEVLTASGWRPWPAVTPAEEFACFIQGKLAFRPALTFHRAPYSGAMIALESADVAYCVTPDHRMWAAPLDESAHRYRFITARDLGVRPARHLTALPPHEGPPPFGAPLPDAPEALAAEARGERVEHTDAVYSAATAEAADRIGLLALALGYSVVVSEDGGGWSVSLRAADHADVLPADGHRTIDYEGTVYCATVPGGLVFVRRDGRSCWCGNSVDSVPAESRSVQPSHFGYIDPVATPENMRAGVDSRVANSALRGRDGRLYSKFVDAKTGKVEYLHPGQLQSAVVAFPGQMEGGRPFVAVMHNGRLTYAPREDVTHSLPAMEDAFGPISNLVPMKSAVKGQRLAMGARMTTQALPLVGAEAPFVQSGAPGPGDESYEQRYGVHMGAVRSEEGGWVKSVSPDAVEVEQPDGTVKAHELAVHEPSNRKTGLNQTPVVRPGDRLRPGQLIARSNYTDGEGVTALGRNVRVAMMPGFGENSNYEDAWVVSRSAADKFRSEHYYQHEAADEDGVSLGKKTFVSAFPGRFPKAVLDNFDEDGVIRPGTEVRPGDPLILAVKQRDANRAQVYRGHGPSYVDKAETWDHHDPGVVTDAVRTKDGVRVVVRTEAAAQVGDKLCLSADHDVLTRRGWVPIAEVGLDDQVACLRDGRAAFRRPLALHRYDVGGSMYEVQSANVSLLVTPWHRMYVRPEGEREFRLVPMVKLLGVRAQYASGLISVNPLPLEPMRIARFGHYAHPVYCLTVHGGVFYVRRRGRKVWTGNSNRMGGKGLIGAIVEDHLMPRDEEGRPAELLFNPAGVISRCYDDQTEFLTESGWKFGRDVHGGDRLKCFDPATFALSWGEQVAPFHGERYRGEMIRVSSPDDLEFVVTPNHKMWGRRWTAAGRWRAHPMPQREAAGKAWHETTAEEMFGTGWLVPGLLHGLRVARYIPADAWSRVPYDGMVFCPSVATGYVVTRRNGKVLIAGNTNPAAAFEFALGKIAEKTGRPYRIKDFDKIDDLAQFTLDEMAKHGVQDFGHVTDPRTGRRIDGVTTGNAFFMKLHHTSASKIQGRGTGGYSADGQPARGVGTNSAKRLALMSLNALLSHGASRVISDGLQVRGQANPEYWLQFMSGHKPPTPEVPHVHQKFFNQLKAAGINVAREGTKFRIKALRSQDVDDLAGGRLLRNGETVSWKEGLKPIKGGLFDEALTGGHGGKNWSAIPLHEPMPSPVFEEPIRRILDLSRQQFRDVLAGTAQLHGATGPGAIRDALKKIDVDRAIEVARADIAAGRKTSRDAAVRRLEYLKSAKLDGIHPGDWIWDKAPVLPPIFRPVSVMQSSKKPLVADVNVLYKELMDADANLRDVSGRVDDVGPERLAVYDALKAAVGLDDPIHPKTVERGVKGLLREIHGSSPKFGTIQRKLLSAPVDLVGRAVIVPNPDLDIDSVGVPESHAWEVYKPFIVRRLVRRGMKHGRALEEVAGRTDHARDAMLDEMKSRPVILDRAPVLHRYGVMAFWPRLVKGDAIHLSPLVTAGYGADFDGDQMNYQVPAGDEAVRDAVEKMLPSKNLLAASNFQAHQTPSREYAAGLWFATREDEDDDRAPVVFKTKKDAIAAYENGEIAVDAPVHILSDS